MKSGPEKELEDLLIKHYRKWRGGRIFKNENGLAVYEYKGRTYRVRYGVGGEGGSDLIIPQTRIITPQMVGRKIAQFVVAELKSDPSIPLEPEQERFINAIIALGGKGAKVTSIEDMEELLCAE